MSAFSGRPDFVVLHVPPGAENPSPVDARDAHFMIELKHDDTLKSNPPKLHDSESGEAVLSTYASGLTTKNSRWTPLEQILDYDCFALAAHGPSRHHMVGLVATCMRTQIMYADRSGCMISEERNFSTEFGVLFAILIGVYRSEAERAGLQAGITPLSGPSGTPLNPLDFDLSSREVQAGCTTNISRPIRPFKVLVRLELDPVEHVAVYARGNNLMERPMPIKEDVARSLCENASQRKVLGTRPSISRLAKSKGMEKNQMIAVSEMGEISSKRSTLPYQFAPRAIFGSGTARYHCVLEASTHAAADSTLQLSWQPKNRLSEASVLRLANQSDIQGVPTLIASGDIANAEDSVIRSCLQQTFTGLESIRPVHKVLRAIVWQEDCIPLSSLGDIEDFLSAAQSILQSAFQMNWRLSLILTFFLVAIVRLHEVGIMHTNISEANMMALRANNSQGILVGFEFAILHKRSSPNKKVCPNPSQPSQDGVTDTEGFGEIRPFPALEQAAGDATTHHVATLPLDRCTDRPPVHQFRHELESCIWSVFFIQASFRRGRRIINTSVEEWYIGGWESIRDSKRRFFKAEAIDAVSAGRFAESLGADPQPLKTCSSALAAMLGDPQQLDAARVLSILQEALDAYAANELTSAMPSEALESS
jgi:hypothetical protein